MGKSLFFFLFLLILGAGNDFALAQHKSQVCSSTGCKCYETWTPYWDNAWQTCRNRIEDQQTGAGEPLKGDAYMHMNRVCSDEAGRLTQAKKETMGVLVDRLQEFREVPCPEAAAQPQTRQPPVDNRGRQMPERQEGVTPPACIKEVESAASACRQAQTAATRACDPQNNAALNASNQQGLAAGDRLAGTSATAGSCSTAAEHQRQYVAALDNFIQSCNGARESCSSSCSDAKSKLERCQNLATEDPGREIGEDSVACGASGPLAQKVSEATQNRNNSAAIQADGESCSSHSNATAAQTSAALGANRQKADTSGGGLGESASVNGGRQNESGSGTALQGRRAFAQNFDRQPSSAGGAGEKYNVSGAMEADADKSAAGNVGYGAGLGDLPATPAMVEGASNAEKSEVTSALGASTLGGGGVGGARLFRLPKLKGAKGLLLGEDGDKAAVSAASEEGSPDLNQFRPQMAGMKAASDIQGAHTGLFENMSKAYQRVKDTLFNEGE